MAPSLAQTSLLAFHLITLTTALNFNISGEAITQRFWDCCKPSCSWKFKADVNEPVRACGKDGKKQGVNAGTGCNEGSAFQCSEQQPWAVNDTFSYGFAGAHIVSDLTGGMLEDAWCCACYRLDFTSEPLRGKSMVVQASNTAYDVMDKNLFTLAVPGGNTSNADACNIQYGVDQSVFGQTGSGVSEVGRCDNLPEALRSGCEWRFDWFKNADFTSANFKRVICPSELTGKTDCVRKDDLAQEKFEEGTAKPGAAVSVSPNLASILSSAVFVIGMVLFPM